MNTATIAPKGTRIRATNAEKSIIERWKLIPQDQEYLEIDLVSNFLNHWLDEIGFDFSYRKTTPLAGPGLRPDMLIYRDGESKPALVIEAKKRIPKLAQVSDEEFTEVCTDDCLYREAVGFDNSPGSGNGIFQYLDIDKIEKDCLAPYGLVFNGDFFQLWRRVDGLIFPITPIERITDKSIPRLTRQLKKCLEAPPTALITSIWNRKGGVAKTTNTINIAATLALAGKKILLIDLDKQGDLAHGLGVQKTQTPFLATAADKILAVELEEAKVILDEAIQCKNFPTTEGSKFQLSVLPVDRNQLKDFLGEDQATSQSYDGGLQTNILRQIPEILKPDYDYIFIDASPAIDKLTTAIFFMCDMVLHPIDGDKAIRHAADIQKGFVPLIRNSRLKHHLPYGPWCLGMVRSNWNIPIGSTVETRLNEQIQQLRVPGKQYETRLKQYAQAQVASMKRVPVVCWHKSPITKLYQELIQEIFLSHNTIY
ncbi:AAA family ATPase [filamentous cyanobacterium LEGE 11480]|uniref:AAA family ATPase n=1 Tax=Romeriopsis navalis LEGE 11480 TaxID=2777977 RepID=A0A928VRL6_9CYAN|nr:ParA family protein [Romeriopsis navalis]MBE9032498.1 AAA family ATPase [Romeriopsis navalis LEGE 11480]